MTATSTVLSGSPAALGAPSRPIESLSGEALNGRWTVLQLLPKSTFQTGSCFSVGYKVEDQNGQKAFAKVLDFSQALQSPDTAVALNEMTNSYIFERRLLELCGSYNLTRIVKGIDFGELARSDVPLGKVFFIIFEMAEGDVRKFINDRGQGSLSWRLHVLHDVAIGLSQLHSRSIFHQDLKPSNVLVFDDGGRSKLADLGRAHCQGLKSPHDDHKRPGAFYYAPPEQIYDHQLDDRGLYRHAGDLYLLGSMLDFFVTAKPTTVRLIERLNEVHKPFAVQINGWRGFFRDVLPHLLDAHAGLVQDFRRQSKGLIGTVVGASEIVDELTNIYAYATNPDPLERGHVGSRKIKHVSNYDLQRFISGFEILSRKLTISERVNAKVTN